MDTEACAAEPAAPEAAVSSVAPVPAPEPKPLRLALEVLHDLVIAGLVALCTIAFVGRPFHVEGPSMQPLLRDGDRILVDKLTYRFRSIERGEVVVFWYPLDPSQSFVKRVVAGPGDRVELRSGQLIVNGQSVDERYLAPGNRDDAEVASHEVSPGHYYVLGDHRNQSNDSRSWGEVPEKYIYGRALWRFWPPTHLGSIR